MVKNGYKVVHGFGIGVGGFVIAGAYDAIYENPKQLSESQLVTKPFVQYVPKNVDIQQVWANHREELLSMVDIALFLFGNKLKEGQLLNADGVMKEFYSVRDKKVIPVPLAETGHAAKQVFDTFIIDDNLKSMYSETLLQKLKTLSFKRVEEQEIQVISQLFLKQFVTDETSRKKFLEENPFQTMVWALMNLVDENIGQNLIDKVINEMAAKYIARNDLKESFQKSDLVRTIIDLYFAKPDSNKVSKYVDDVIDLVNGLSLLHS